MTTSDPAPRPLALVTGASSGIGRAFCERLAAGGYNLIITARRQVRLEALAAELKAAHGTNVEVIVADLADAGDLARLEERIAAGAALALLVNNAGFPTPSPLIKSTPDYVQAPLQVHIIALTRLTCAALPGMLAADSGTIINVCSMLAFSGGMRGTYAATKAYVRTFTEALHNELAGTGVRVQALCPGIVDTEWSLRSGIDVTSDAYKSRPMMSPADVVTASLKGLELGEVLCLPNVHDLGLLAAEEEARKRLFAVAPTRGDLAARYTG